ncbi:MAG: rhomboid family intramembrane serine protease [Bacteroidales bacterium]|nr:rhomboid family intramembrane serine protease [Bacteroidales bacterium]
MFNRNPFSDIPPVVKYLLLVNVVMFIVAMFVPVLDSYCALYSFRSPLFKPVQLVTHMFMHGGFWHLFFNMFSLYMFGRVLESYWGSKRFFIYYFVAGIGGALFYLLVKEIEMQVLMSSMSPEAIEDVMRNGADILMQGKNYIMPEKGMLNLVLNVPCVGASGAIYGLLLAFGIMFPNVEMYIYFAIPVKAKWMVIAFVVIELLLGILNAQGDNVAHFAHFGGMLVGFILLMIWRKKGEV